MEYYKAKNSQNKWCYGYLVIDKDEEYLLFSGNYHNISTSVKYEYSIIDKHTLCLKHPTEDFYENDLLTFKNPDISGTATFEDDKWNLNVESHCDWDICTLLYNCDSLAIGKNTYDDSTVVDSDFFTECMENIYEK